MLHLSSYLLVLPTLYGEVVFWYWGLLGKLYLLSYASSLEKLS
jgi:lipid-A-disaccharide synthase-like uncharacterized protein